MIGRMVSILIPCDLSLVFLCIPDVNYQIKRSFLSNYPLTCRAYYHQLQLSRRENRPVGCTAFPFGDNLPLATHIQLTRYVPALRKYTAREMAKAGIRKLHH